MRENTESATPKFMKRTHLGSFGAALLGLLAGVAFRLDALLATRTEGKPNCAQINPCALSLVWSVRFSLASGTPSARCAAV